MTAPSFRDLGVSAPVVAALAANGIESPFPVQSMVIGDALAGTDVLAKSPTGSGKTLAFAIPIVDRADPSAPTPSALVLVPTRELAVQVADEFKVLAPVRKLRTAAVFGGVSTRAQAQGAKGAHVLVATPGRLIDLMQQRVVSLDNVTTLVLDEADRMLDMGFKPQVDRIVRRMPADRQTMFFSATLDGEVGILARAYTRNPRRHEVESPGETIEQVDHQFVSVTHDTKLDRLIELVTEADGATLVFVRTKRGASRLAEKLARRGVKVVAMHGDMTQGARQDALNRFERGQVKTLVATDVAARGIDLDHITHVVNFDPPDDNKSYVHRVGRTGRAGRTGTGVTFVTSEQQADVSRIASRLALREEFEREGMTVAPPKLVYSSRARRGRRRF